MRPVDRGYIKYESLKDGTVSLLDLDLCNDAIDIREENAARQRAAEEARRGR